MSVPSNLPDNDDSSFIDDSNDDDNDHRCLLINETVSTSSSHFDIVTLG